MTNIEIIRSGNLLAFPKTQRLLELCEKHLFYLHRTYFQGYELRERQQLKRQHPAAIKRPEFEDVPSQLFQVVGSDIVCGAGLYAKVRSLLESQGYSVAFKDLRQNKIPPAQFECLRDIPDLKFRYKQDEVLVAIDSSHGGVIEAPTGYGKTFLMGLLSRIYPNSRICFASPGIDLLKSTYNRLNEIVPGDVGRVGGGHYEPNRRIILASADSLHKVDISKMHLIVFDEVHEAATTTRIRKLIHSHTDAKYIAFSASPNMRADGADALIESIFGPILLVVNYAEAADKGVVTPIQHCFVEYNQVDMMLSKNTPIATRKKLCYTLNTNRNNVIARTCKLIPEWLDRADPQILVMAETVEHIYELKQLLPDYEVVYASMSPALHARLLGKGHIGEDYAPMTSQRREDLLKRFEKGELRRVIANFCWKQGIDPVHLNAFVRADGGTSAIKSIQLPGRLSRLAEGKTEGLLIDFADKFCPWVTARTVRRRKLYRDNGYIALPPARV